MLSTNFSGLLEGIVSKLLSAPYRSGPSRDLLKIKNPDSASCRNSVGFEGLTLLCGRRSAIRSTSTTKIGASPFSARSKARGRVVVVLASFNETTHFGYRTPFPVGGRWFEVFIAVLSGFLIFNKSRDGPER